MSRSVIAAAVLAAAVLACSTAYAQPRAEPQVELKAVLPVTEPAEIGAWLQRLAGRFAYDGMVQMGDCVAIPAEGPPPPPTENCQILKGNSDCVGIGTGPGVQCILNVTWLDIWNVSFETGGSVSEGLVSYLDPAMELYGLDPGYSAINHMIVNNKGLSNGGLGYVKGNTGTFKMPCGSASPDCFRITIIEAKPGKNLMHVWFAIELPGEPAKTYAVMTLRRASQARENLLPTDTKTVKP